jgi:hypothetical protein
VACKPVDSILDAKPGLGVDESGKKYRLTLEHVPGSTLIS